LTSPAAAPKIEALHVTHVFSDVRTQQDLPVLDDVSISVPDGQFVALIGPSGCGKSTLLNLVSGLITPTHGTVIVDGRVVAGIDAARVGYMFARDTLLPWRTVRSNVEFGLEALGRGSSRDRQERARELLRMVGLHEFEAAYRDQLSQGMRQRVALARTLAPSPEILLMDEPFAALDVQTRAVMGAEFLRIWERDRKTVLFVTHDLTEAVALADRVVVMSPRPARIVGDHRVNLPRPRNPIDLAFEPGFQALLRRLWEDLRPQVLAEA
jgi:NitT/TauT family transport system ATP-binding protein